MKIEIIPNEQSIFKILSKQWTQDHTVDEAISLKKIIYYTRANLVKLLLHGCEKFISRERKNLEAHFYSHLKKEVNSVFVFLENEEELETHYSKLCFMQRAFLREKLQGKLPYWFNTDNVLIDDDNNIEIKIQDDFQQNTLLKNDRFKRLLKKITSRIKLKGYKFIKDEINIDVQLKAREKEISVKKQIENSIKSRNGVEKVEKKEIISDPVLLLGKKIKAQGIPVSEIENDFEGRSVVLGKVFHIERNNIFNDKKDIGKKKGILSFFISDNKDSIEVVVFYSVEEWDSSVISPGQTIKIRGKVEVSNFSGEQVLKAYAINAAEESELLDDDSFEAEEQEKRVEFHLHTKMSKMDSILDLKDVFKAAKRKGLHAFAVTDHGVVQGYPFISKYSKDYSVSGIFGLEGYMINSEEPSIQLSHKTPCKPKFSEEEFVVFDLETTGFSPRANRIIEIGAVKIKNWSVIDRFSVFCELEGEELPSVIVDLTGITERMLEGNPGEKDNLIKFREFVGNGILVAHNSDFDVNFINYRMKKYKLDKFQNTVIDTLRLSQVVFTELKRFSLKALCKKLKITLESHHRAIHDAEATYFLFRKILKEIEKDGIHDVEEMAKKLVLKNFKRMRSHHVLLIAKTQDGIRDIYNIVSKSHIEYFFKNPRIPSFMIEEAREKGTILVGSACESGDLIQNYVRGASDEQLYSIAEKYDFIEIQPIRNNIFMLDKGIFRTVDDIYEMNKKLLQIANDLGKICIATCDAHMLDEDENHLRKILQFGQKYKDYEKSQALPLMNTSEMLEEFKYLGEQTARKIVIDNTFKLYDLIDHDITPIPKEFFPPIMEGSENEITEMAYEKLERVYGTDLPQLIKDRVDKEINSIVGNGFSVLYLIAQKLVKKSNDDGYLVGSRGSVGSSFVAWLMDITEVNPLPSHYLCEECKVIEFTDAAFCGVDLKDKECPECGKTFKKCGFDIPFEVFMGFKGDKTPDIDLNFSGDYQRNIHAYTRKLFGDEYVYKAGTIGTISDKTAETFVRKYYEETGVSIRKPEIKRVSGQLKGIKRTTGQHPGGLIIVPKDNNILNFSPIQFPANDTGSDVFTTHFDYHVMDSQLVKLDLLGHDNPTSIKELEGLTEVKSEDIPLDDPET
ncbi:PolC-type DNA polymerase III, partial [bacterium]|nr:PolC-type DNA polymerase III [bacterium]